ncbi:Sterol 3-beta-glucosyltransferase-like protein 1 [Elsinoe fawcettii]|nr:Sterol 3-beta-glucosyltransferase-like protein 1 [Elsinoe fawcettii]
MAADGRVDINFESRWARILSVLYGSPSPAEDTPNGPSPAYTDATGGLEKTWALKLNIVIQVVGSRGDVQPFIALGAELRKYGHRVRLATHNVFERFVLDSGLEFFPIGGDPSQLMAYMVKNPGLIPSMKSLQAGEITQKRLMVEDMLDGCWRSCIEADPLTEAPFVADAIIANPPSFAHVHCAQALGVPVHLMFTMPWSKTKAFPHPLANLISAGAEKGYVNFASYAIVDYMTWQGLGDVINEWRATIDLKEINMFDDVCGFFFRDPPRIDPPQDIVAFLEVGSKPIYIGFGSIVLDDPDRITSAIIEAVTVLGIRAIVSRGWSKLGGKSDRHDDILFVGDCSHEWLFQHVAAVIHHGGAGTTACGLRLARPTAVVPFFGDQPFWANMIATAGAGPQPIPQKDLTAERLAKAIEYCLTPDAISSAREIALRMASEAGVEAAVQSFHRNLPLENARCQILPDIPARWRFKNGQKETRLSKLAVEVILAKDPSARKCIKIYEPKRIVIEPRRSDPISGGASAVMCTATDLATSVTGLFTKPITEYRHERTRQVYRENALGTTQTSADGSKADDASTAISTSNSIKKKSLSTSRLTRSSAMSIASFVPTALKGMMVDIPLAMTEGLRNIPSHYGDKVRDHGPVTGIKSGAAVAGKTFAWGFADGLSDVVVKPYQGAREEGVKGAIKGIGKGLTSLTTKTGAGMFGLAAYTSAGIAKTIRKSVHSGTTMRVAEASLAEGRWLVERHSDQIVEADVIWRRFQGLKTR